MSKEEKPKRESKQIETPIEDLLIDIEWQGMVDKK